MENIIFSSLFIIGYVLCIPAAIIIVVGLIEVPYSHFKAKKHCGYRNAATGSWLLSVGSLFGIYDFLSSLGSGGVSGLMIPPLLVIPSILSLCYVYLVFKSHKGARNSKKSSVEPLSDINKKLIEAVVNNDLDLVKRLVFQGANPKAKNESGYSAEDFARGRGLSAISKFLD
ncbi:hypothetical protein SAMN03080615_04187 [Amphritea atlantica]|uniref:Uncharacterized protein n=1 Tax=Amphritea atlantica TaxID=355243 RepID=A0A1H9M059_9GAMM|nr:hypothetical protein [Amphritea atlantica]SER16825.1 hypothetical protein SAMN03080615_04187 [Amphritea atlantica]